MDEEEEMEEGGREERGGKVNGEIGRHFCVEEREIDEDEKDEIAEREEREGRGED